MAALLLSLLTLACIMVFLDHVAGTKNIILAIASFSSVYLLIFYSKRAIASTSCTDERRTSIRAAWCASLILVLILGFQVQEYAARSTKVYIWMIAVCVQVAVLIILEFFQQANIAEGFQHTSPV